MLRSNNCYNLKKCQLQLNLKKKREPPIFHRDLNESVNSNNLHIARKFFLQDKEDIFDTDEKRCGDHKSDCAL